jgi:isoamylase
LLLSQGTPMLLAGDEFGRTQQGNNNAYCQDNEISWLNWNIQDKGRSLISFVQKLIGLRHTYPILRRNLFLSGQYLEELGVKDVTWINADGSEMDNEHWGDSGLRCFGMLLDGRAQPTGIRQLGHEATLLLVINGHHEPVKFKLPECFGGSEWSILVDTNEPGKGNEVKRKTGEEHEVTARSFLLFCLKADPESVST